ncbi:MAG: YitT family protein, partial [Ginsengibacter sp.]
YLGTNDFTAKAENLFGERQTQHKVQTREQWMQQQKDFIGSHSYFTVSASHQLNQKKYENLSKVKQSTESANPGITHKGKSNLKHDFIFIVLGVFSAAFALESFLVPNLFFDGGATGIALLISKLTGLDLPYVIALVNLPFIIMGYFVVNLKFALKTSLCIVLLALCLFIPFHTVTSDKLLVSFFGGFFLGIGSGFVMRAGCAIDGTEILALYTWRKTSFTISEIIMAINIIIFGTVAIILSMETALYSLLTYITASKTIDYVVEGLEAYQGVTIISGKSEIIKDRLVNNLGRGITVYKGERGYLPGNYHVHEDCDIIFTVITRLELRKLKNLVAEIDPKAFVIANPIKDASGGIIKKRLEH